MLSVNKTLYQENSMSKQYISELPGTYTYSHDIGKIAQEAYANPGNKELANKLMEAIRINTQDLIDELEEKMNKARGQVRKNRHRNLFESIILNAVFCNLCATLSRFNVAQRLH
jgi:hypothetical protein